jgi:dienelactone hydrolase
MAQLSLPPRVWKGEEKDGVQSLFYEGLPWRGRRTRIFAYCGVPQADAPVPGIVLVHGGGGSAFAPWVKLWNRRGYAAIAMDTCGCISGGGHMNHTRHEHGGPAGWGGFDHIDDPIEEQWCYHAVAAAIAGHSLLASSPGVDAQRIGTTGISWGGFLACILAGIDPRLRFAAPVYGCGFMDNGPIWAKQDQEGERARRWLALWDPCHYLPAARMPMLWLTGTNDFAFPMNAWQKSYRLPKGPRRLSLRLGLAHGHQGPGENPPEILAFADSITRGGRPLPELTVPTSANPGPEPAGEAIPAGPLVCRFAGPLVRAELIYTTTTGPWIDRRWSVVDADIDPAAGILSACAPGGVTACYFSGIDDRGLISSSEHLEAAGGITVPAAAGS